RTSLLLPVTSPRHMPATRPPPNAWANAFRLGRGCLERLRQFPEIYADDASSRSQRSASGEIHSAPDALAVSCSRKSLVATRSLNRPAYLLARRSTIEYAV